jgi:hypothetical protein
VEICSAEGKRRGKQDEDRQGGFEQSSAMHQYSVSLGQVKKGKGARPYERSESEGRYVYGHCARIGFFVRRAPT